MPRLESEDGRRLISSFYSTHNGDKVWGTFFGSRSTKSGPEVKVKLFKDSKRKHPISVDYLHVPYDPENDFWKNFQWEIEEKRESKPLRGSMDSMVNWIAGRPAFSSPTRKGGRRKNRHTRRRI